jgi:hypothetical protein
MPVSPHYKSLKSSITRYRHALLPSTFDPTGSYRSPDRIHIRSLSFRIIVHAEIEAYIEDRTHELLDTAWSTWGSKRVPSDVIIGLLAYSGIDTQLPPKKLGKGKGQQKSYDDMNDIINKAQSAWRSCHKGNHGIKEEHLLRLVLPLGIKHTDLDTTLLADLSSYGISRGEAAHSSNAIVKKFADPKSEFDQARKIVADLEKLDQLITKAISRIKDLSKALCKTP